MGRLTHNAFSLSLLPQFVRLSRKADKRRQKPIFVMMHVGNEEVRVGGNKERKGGEKVQGDYVGKTRNFVDKVLPQYIIRVPDLILSLMSTKVGPGHPGHPVVQHLHLQ